MDADRERWDARWRAVPEVTETAAPDVLVEHPSLVEVVPTTGRALDLACGLGAPARWLAERGLTVTALDVSPVAIGRLNAATERGAHVDGRVWDTDDGIPADLTDLAVIICQRYRSPALHDELVRRLRIGGVLVMTVLSAVGLDGDAGPFHAPAGELTSAFDRVDTEVLLHVEGDGQASIVLRRTS